MTDTQEFFEDIFKGAKTTAVMLMNSNGIIERVNGAFTTAFGYSTDDLKGKHFRLLYIEKDKLLRKPDMELANVHEEGASNDENYLLHKNGTPIWVTGEAVQVKTKDSNCVAKIIHNIHAQKQLERFLLRTTELLDGLFESVQQSGLLIVDSTLRVVKMNACFKQMFGVDEPVEEGAKLKRLAHPFWREEEIQNDLRQVVVSGGVLNKEYVVESAGEKSRLHIESKTIVEDGGQDKQVLLVIRKE